MHNAWRKRAEEAETREAELRAEIAAKDAEIGRLRAELTESQRWVAKYETEQSANSMMVLVEHDEHDRLLALDEENKRLRAELAKLDEQHQNNMLKVETAQRESERLGFIHGSNQARREIAEWLRSKGSFLLAQEILEQCKWPS